jgi:prefoldin subunit 5
MDAARLLSTAQALVADESRLDIANKIQTVINSLSNMSSQPGQPAYQIQLREALSTLLNITDFKMTANPVFASYAAEIDAEEFFGPAMIENIARIIDENAMTPAAAQQQIQELASRRAQYVQGLYQLVNSLTQVHIKPEKLEPGESQIGFRIPRDIFGNELDGWIDELRVIRRVMRAFSELATGKSEDLQIGEISTTDPIIFLAAAAPTIALLGGAVSWSIDQWKKVEEVRKLRAETQKISDQSGGALDALVADFDQRITSMIDTSIEAHAKALVQPGEVAGRGHEQVNDITYALRALTARVERGMTIELRFLPPAPDANGEVPQAYVDIEKIVPTLAFPPTAGDPVILLPRYGD